MLETARAKPGILLSACVWATNLSKAFFPAAESLTFRLPEVARVGIAAQAMSAAKRTRRRVDFMRKLGIFAVDFARTLQVYNPTPWVHISPVRYPKWALNGKVQAPSP